ncbi:hypothetical protein [Qipengyuania nanhaisediminis]|uniref:Conjugation TrbI-like protein n=1 Tax=Qipengyuania nanhaisediminis TaxID=604088 RepID=A0A1I5KAL7_9SPHN|nr:hypothetical protein [Qipengyuania nanhaisediminis]SFO81661.1 hypothetical protein SAMN04488060_0017 [Qipengyuania nanhaisediminis]
MYKYFLLAGAGLIGASPVAAQEAPLPVQAVRAPAHPETVLPAGTEIALQMSQTVTTKGRGWEEGDQFGLTVAAPVMLGDFVVIPKGTKAVGRITWLTSRGAFGKSGKMDIELEHLELGGRRINIDGTYRQEGKGATLATVGGVIAAGVFAGFITGRSGEIPQGRELMATLESDLPVALPEGATLAPKPVTASYVPGSVQAEEARQAAVEVEQAEAAEAARPATEIKIQTKND